MKVKSVEAKGVLADLLANFDEKEYEEVKKEMIMEDYKIRREEEIVQQSIKEFPRFAERRVGFIAGATWSDENPKEGLVDINKAAEWLQDNTMSSLCLDLGNTQLVREFIDDFKKAME